MSTQANAFTPDGGLRRLAAFGATGLALSALGLVGVGIPCPWRLLTGTLCPLCGATHLGMRLLVGDVSGAFAANPFVFIVLTALTALAVTLSVELAGGPRLRPPWWLTADRAWLALSGAALLFAVVRNVT